MCNISVVCFIPLCTFFLSGCFVKCNEWPASAVGRTARWGWTLESEWVIYTTDREHQPFFDPSCDSGSDDDDDDEWDLQAAYQYFR